MNPDHEQRLVGLLDLVDVAAYVVKLWDDNPDASSVKFDKLFEQSLKDKKAGDVMNYSKMNDCHFLSEKATFKDVLKTLSLPGVHRVPMMSRHGLLNRKSKRHLSRFLTQSDVLRFVATHLDDFGAALDETILGSVGSYPAHCVHHSTKTVDAFREMLNKKITGIGVIDSNRNLIGHLSMRDIGYVVTHHPGAELALPLKDFLRELRESGQGPKNVISCGNADSVRSVITKLNSNRIHRIYVIDAASRPCGVVSLSDICQFLLHISPEKYSTPTHSPRAKEEKVKKVDLTHLTELVNEALASSEAEEKKEEIAQKLVAEQERQERLEKKEEKLEKKEEKLEKREEVKREDVYSQ